MRNLNIVLTVDDEMASWLDATLEKHNIQIADAIREALILCKPSFNWIHHDSGSVPRFDNERTTIR